MRINMEGLKEEGIKIVTIIMKRKKINMVFKLNILFCVILNIILI